MTNVKPTVVLVHGGFVDGAGWEGIPRHPDDKRSCKCHVRCRPKMPRRVSTAAYP